MRRILRNHLLPVLISFALLFAAVPSYAATECCDPANMAMHSPDAAQNSATDFHKIIPGQMSKDACAAICVSMASVTLIASQTSLFVPIAGGEPSWSTGLHPSGITDPPALPPPIALA